MVRFQGGALFRGVTFPARGRGRRALMKLVGRYERDFGSCGKKKERGQYRSGDNGKNEIFFHDPPPESAARTPYSTTQTAQFLA